MVGFIEITSFLQRKPITPCNWAENVCPDDDVCWSVINTQTAEIYHPTPPPKVLLSAAQEI